MGTCAISTRIQDETAGSHVQILIVKSPQDIDQKIFHPLPEQRAEQGEHGGSLSLRACLTSLMCCGQSSDNVGISTYL